MSNGTQTAIAVAGVCVLALVLIVLGRRRRRSEVETSDAGVADAVVVDVPAGRMVMARTHDGAQYQGTLVEPEAEHSRGGYLVLTGPIVFRRAGGETEAMPSVWDRLELPLADVAEVWTRPAPVAEHAVPTSVADDVIARLRAVVDDVGDTPTTDALTSDVPDLPRRERRASATTS